MSRTWNLLPTEPELALQLAKNLNVHEVVGHLLVHRGIRSAEEGRRFLDRRLVNLFDPGLLPGATEAADRIVTAARSGKNICIYGDYDVDGMCATALLLATLRLLGIKGRFYVPDRLDEGYGVNAEALRTLKSEGVDLVVTVDCGIASVHEAEVAREIGLEYIVTDHHEFAERLPPADVLVHPRLHLAPGGEERMAGSKPYPFGHLCGCGVAFKLAWEIGKRVSGQDRVPPNFQQFLITMIPMTALATVCDVVPLLDENRILVFHGTKFLGENPSLGLRHLMAVAGLEKERLSASDLGFMLGPRLNACGRLGQARLGVELLSTENEAKAVEIARYLESKNKDRQTLERRIFQDARAQAETVYDLASGKLPSGIVLSSPEWHPGVIGIVASRMVERFHRPCILIAEYGDGPASGSGRSVPGFSLHEALNECSGHLVSCGGHAMAAGLKIAPSNVAAFREQFEKVASRMIPEEKRLAQYNVELEVPLHVLNPKLMQALSDLAPFGAGNPDPLFMATGLTLDGEPKCLGGGERHLSFSVRQRAAKSRAIAFNQADRVKELPSGDEELSVLFSPTLNEFRGYRRVEMRVKDFKLGSPLNWRSEDSEASIE